MPANLVLDILIVLTAGLAAGLLSRQLGVSVLIGYLLVGAIIGESTLGLITDDDHELETVAEAGVFLLLFSIGLEFSLEELLGLGRSFLIGGSAQMLLVAVPATVGLMAMDLDLQVALLLAIAASFSSTVLVFKALSEWGLLSVPHGRRAVGILLFQDAALIPFLLLIPLVTGAGESATLADYSILLVISLLFVGSVVVARQVIGNWIIPKVAAFRSPDLVVLFTLVTLGGITFVAYSIGLPPATGAFAAGLIFSGNRWTEQVDALILPFRESFSAIFFVSLGMIANPALIWQQPGYFLGGLIGVLVLKAVAGILALRLTGLSWRIAAGMGVGLAQIGEFAFVLVLLGRESGALSAAQYERFVTISLASLVLTPLLIKWGLQWTQAHADSQDVQTSAELRTATGKQAIIIGAGPTGRQVTSRLELTGYDVCVIDFSPVNLHTFSQQGFRTVSGDATQPEILRHARAAEAALIVVSVADDNAALGITRSVRQLNDSCLLIVRCRYHTNIAPLKKLGASHVVSEEAVASRAIENLLLEEIS